MMRAPLPRRLTLALSLLAVTACRSGPRQASPASPSTGLYQPAHDLGTLFGEVQSARVFPDSKSFVDAVPLMPPAEIVAAYDRERGNPGFDLRAFVARHFLPPATTTTASGADSAETMEAHIRALWPALTRAPPPPGRAWSSLIALPDSYVVPGGRFREIYYWDSYFTMLGLVRSGRTDLVKAMLDNFAWLIDRTGHVPNGNRTYYLGRSQPPYFAAMIALYAQAVDTAAALAWLPALEREYAFWMDGADRVQPARAWRRVVRLPGGALLNRYWDDLPEPRPESWREDVALGASIPEARRTALYREIRATAESGWDFSSRWMRDPHDLRTLETTELAPVDLNCLLYHAERTIAALRAFRDQPGDAVMAARFAAAAARRREALMRASWDSVSGFFYDVRWASAERVTDRPTLAAVSPLFFGLASPAQARAVALVLQRDFLQPGGFVTTRIASGQQWDAPNGWPPLQWLAIEGLRRHGLVALADTARTRWLALNRRTWRATGRMMEKYDVTDTTRAAGGGEYPTQDGFGWTNGVALALSGR